MAATKITDVIVPEVFNGYVIQRSVEMDALVQAGIVSNQSDLDALAQAGGRLINMPFWNALTGADEVLSDSGSLTPGAITSGQDVAVLHGRGRAWGVNDLAASLSGDDPMGAIASQVAKYWAGRRQALLLSTLKGIFATTLSGTHIHDVTGNVSPADEFSADNFLDAVGLLGDAMDALTAIAVHSAVYVDMQKKNLIDLLPDSEGRVSIPSYMGKRVIVDDLMPNAAGAYTSYLFGPGAIGLGMGNAPVPTETDRDSLAGEDYLINRQQFILHPRGVKFTDSSVAGTFPTNAECEAGANWSKVYDNKNIKIVAFVHAIAS